MQNIKKVLVIINAKGLNFSEYDPIPESHTYHSPLVPLVGNCSSVGWVHFFSRCRFWVLNICSKSFSVEYVLHSSLRRHTLKTVASREILLERPKLVGNPSTRDHYSTCYKLTLNPVARLRTQAAALLCDDHVTSINQNYASGVSVMDLRDASQRVLIRNSIRSCRPSG